MPDPGHPLRAEERKSLLRCLDSDGPWVVAVHGIGGIGKTTLLREFATLARDRGARVVVLDGDAVEPTQSGFRASLIDALATVGTSIEDLASADDGSTPPVVLVLDVFDNLRLLETWLRQSFLPSVGGALRLVTATRSAPAVQWVSDPVIGPRFQSLGLETLTDDDAYRLLDEAGVTTDARESLVRAAHGHPLALRLATHARGRAVADGPGDATIEGVLRDLTQFYVDEIGDARLRRAVEAASTVRRVTEPLLAAMLDAENADDTFAALQELHFVQVRNDGIALHDAVREFVCAELRARDPRGFAHFRRAAWRQMRQEIHHAPSTLLWRYTADLIYLIENPVVREAFFPSTAPHFVVEPARVDDEEAILAISSRHESEPATRWIDFWWNRAPDAFFVARDDAGHVAGFYCSLDTDRVRSRDLREDPVTALWWEHLRASGGGQALFLRRWLSREHGEVPSPVQAACWLDLKRSYLALRPRLRRVYLTIVDPTPYLPVARRLGFVPLDDPVALGDTPYASACLDFGPRSVDGWMRRLFTQELGEMGPEDGALLDLESRQLLAPDGPRELSPLEFGVLRFLVENEGMAVSRSELLADVWNIHHDGSSNVVDTVIRSLRNKLGDRAWRIESVRGVGYRCLPAS